MSTTTTPTVLQGSNNPLVITFDADISELAALSVSLWNTDTGQKMRAWTLDEITVDGDTAKCPLTEAESRAFPARNCVLEAKGLDADGNTVFWWDYPMSIGARYDRNIVMTQMG